MNVEPQALSLPHRLRPPRIDLVRPPLLVLLHGQGGDEHTLFELANLFDDRFLVVSPRGPYRIFSHSFAWLPPSQDPLRSSQESPRTVQCCDALLKFIKEGVQSYGCDPNQVYLFGFGQGAILGLSLMVTEPESLAGVVAASGQTPDEVHSIPLPNERFRDFAVLVTHGQLDEIHPVEYGKEIRDILSALGTDLSYREYNCGHTLSREVLTDVRAWLSQRLNQRGVSFVVRTKIQPPPYQLELAGLSIGVRNLDRSIAFYMRFLGLHLIERVANAYAFLGFDPASGRHVLTLENVGTQTPGTPLQSTGLHHIAFQVADCREFALAYQTLSAAGLKVRTTDHFIRWSLYFNDPDRNGIQIFVDTRDQPGKAALWQGRNLPLEPADILAALETKETG
jgi:phospholipase/carboxylesterase